MQTFSQFVGTQPFFNTFPFGYTSPVNWFEAAGIPITPPSMTSAAKTPIP